MDEAVIHFHDWREGLEITPTLIALRKKIDTIADAETERTLKSLNHLTPEDQMALNRMMKSMVNKILHDPTLFLKSEGVGENKSLVLDVIRKLFNLDNQD